MRSLRLLGTLSIAVLLGALSNASDKKDGSLQTSNVHFTVVKDDNNKPVRNASVILHPVEKDGGQSKGGFQIKADNDGKVVYEGLPYGRLRVQVLAPGMQTFGEDYDINKPEMDIEIRLKRPGEQLSVYDKAPAKQQAPQATSPAPKPQ